EVCGAGERGRRTAALNTSVATLISDADCAMCRKSALWLMRRAFSSGALEVLSCRSPVPRACAPQVNEDECLSAMQLVLPDGRRLSGAGAVPEVLRRDHGGGGVARGLSAPPR